MTTFNTKADVDNFLKSLDYTQKLPVLCKKVVDKVAKESPELFDTICESIESSKKSVAKYPDGFCATIWGTCKGERFQLSYDASRVPKAYAFVCILKTILPE